MRVGNVLSHTPNDRNHQNLIERVSKKPAAAPAASQKLTVAERRAFIWANPRTRLKGAPGPYDLSAAHTDRDRADDRRGYSPREVRGEGGV